ncbi:MAG: hypothetical protein JNK63_03890 [Chthonomonas sp.]|nr:hypothetical protein [Chthonomonas sp.]
MNKLSVILLLLVSSLMVFGFATQTSSTIDRKQLREILVQLGYEVNDIVKEAGKEKYAVTFEKYDLTIPVGFEISPSNSYIWLTVNLGDAPTSGNDKCLQLLKQNGKVQPTFFYITEGGKLMAALAVENRGVTNAILKTRAETIAENVGKTRDIWQK